MVVFSYTWREKVYLIQKLDKLLYIIRYYKKKHSYNDGYNNSPTSLCLKMVQKLLVV